MTTRAKPLFTKPRANMLSPTRNVPKTEASIWRGSARDIVKAADEFTRSRIKVRPLRD